MIFVNEKVITQNANDCPALGLMIKDYVLKFTAPVQLDYFFNHTKIELSDEGMKEYMEDAKSIIGKALRLKFMKKGASIEEKKSF